MSYTKVGEWSGKDLFKCDDCKFQTVSIPQRDKHDAEAHPRARAPLTKILDPDGKPFESIPIEDPHVVDVEVPKGLPEPVRKDLAEHAEREARAAEREEEEVPEDGEPIRPSWWRRSSQDKEQSK